MKTSIKKTRQEIGEDLILVRRGIVSTAEFTGGQESPESVGTLLANMAELGYAPSIELLREMRKQGTEQLSAWWARIEPILKEITGASRKMDRFVVYKNFPAEVLEMSAAQYWISQIFMYLGAPNEWFAEDEQERPKMNEKLTLKTLRPARGMDMAAAFEGLLGVGARWVPEQEEEVRFLLGKFKFDLSQVKFKENLGIVGALLAESGVTPECKSATDALRMAVAISGGDPSLKSNKGFKMRFKRPVRRMLLSMLEQSTNIVEDAARRPGMWKDFLSKLHPGEFAWASKTSAAYDMLYNDKAKTWYSAVEIALKSADPKGLELLSQRPGDFARRLRHACQVYGDKAVTAFSKCAAGLSVLQLAKLAKHAVSSVDAVTSAYAPKGDWSKMKTIDPRRFSSDHALAIQELCSNLISTKIKSVPGFEDGVVLFADADRIKVQTNGADLSPVGRGTKYPMPEDTGFIRTSSYWKIKSGSYVWFDNGWNFFDENWVSKGACAWNAYSFGNGAAVFSGDPTNTKEMQGRACQMIDLYPQKMRDAGVRYGVWSILAYSGIRFSQAEDVFAALQVGRDPEKGKLFEPSRAMVTFPLTGDYLTKFICYIDFETMEVCYMDFSFNGRVSSATSNSGMLSRIMPAARERLENSVSVHDIFEPVAVPVRDVIPASLPIITGDDSNVPVEENGDRLVYAAKRTSQGAVYRDIDINQILNAK